MATLDSLKGILRQSALAPTASPTQPLSDAQYDTGFDILMQGSRTTYGDFIVPQLSLLLASFYESLTCISVLEIGPGPQSVLGNLPICLKRKINRYTAYEPNDVFATRLDQYLCYTQVTRSPLPCLRSPPDICRFPFTLDSDRGAHSTDWPEKFDLILFCHSLYGLNPKDRFIKQALEILSERSGGGMVVIFHRDRTLDLDGLVCHRTASFPHGVVRVLNDDRALDSFALFIAGYTVQDVDANNAVQLEWRRLCRALGRCEEAHPDHLLFSSPNVMVAFTQHATALPELTAHVPVVSEDYTVKNRDARLHRPALVVKPKAIRHVQHCVRWALKHKVGLTIVGGGHSGHCLQSNVVAVHMGDFNKVHIVTLREKIVPSDPDPHTVVVAEAGCTSQDIISQAMAADLTVPVGSRPSVGAGLWLQGGIGHLARLHGLTCDAIVGVVVVSVTTGSILCIGDVPSRHRPYDAVRPENDTDLLWAMRGAGTNFGVVISLTFKAYKAPCYYVRDWVVPLSGSLETRLKLNEFDTLVAENIPRHCSADAYLYWHRDKLQLGVTMIESSTARHNLEAHSNPCIGGAFGPVDDTKVVDGLGLFGTELYMSRMHGGHGGGKTSSFKRCLFLKAIAATDVADVLSKAVDHPPSPLCYIHPLHGGGAVRDVADNATAFGCRDWNFACVVTGAWLRHQDETEVARAAVQWVYNVARDLLPLSCGAYGADLGPDPRDAALAARAFGPNAQRLARLKLSADPSNVIAYACPLPEASTKQKLVVLVTGESRAGKDYCANSWVSVLTTSSGDRLTARVVSISDATKREYAAVFGADLKRLLYDRAYKEQHRTALSNYFRDQVQQRPQTPVEHFLGVVRDAVDVDVLFITGMRDEAPIAALSHLIPHIRVLEVRIKASSETRRARRGCQGSCDDGDDNKSKQDGEHNNSRPSFIFTNETTGDEVAKAFCKQHLLHYFHKDLQRLSNMVRQVPNFPDVGIEFHDVLGISQWSGGLKLCASLFQTHFAGDWSRVNVVACCETGGFLYTPLLAAHVNVPLALIREAGKLPPPTISVSKSPSHISLSGNRTSGEKKIEIGRDVLFKGASVVVVDDVLATGNTLRAVLQLLAKAGIGAEDVAIMVVAEFPAHRGREFLHRHGFGGVNIQSLLVFGGV